MRRTWKMKTKILLLCLGVTVLALIFQMILFQQSSSKMIYEQAKNESFHSLQNMQEDAFAEALLALQSLGYSNGEAVKALGAVRGQSDKADELVRLALRSMM